MNKPNKLLMRIEATDYLTYLSNPNTAPDIPVYLTNTIRGKAHIAMFRDDEFVTIPKHALERDWTYFIYYVAHELAHINNWRVFKAHHHNKTFYDCFEQLCPPDCRKWELGYKVSYGKRLEHEHLYSIIICKNGIKTAKCRYCNSKKLLNKATK